MSLSGALFKDQGQAEQDMTDGPGWTIDSEKPGFFSGVGTAPFRGIGQGVDDGIAVLAKGLQFPQHESEMDAVMSGPAGAARYAETKGEIKPWQADYNAKLQGVEDAVRSESKSLMGDPRVTGTGANLVQGFSKAATEFSGGNLMGGPAAGAALLGASEGYARYNDLRDQGVDEETAKKSGLITAVSSGGASILPMALPAKWLAGLSTAGTLAVQAGAGAAINTSFGAASRYASSKILEDAGYPEQAAQEKPWDETNLLTDALSGLFFGAHAGWHGLKSEPGTVDPAIRDAAKVVQDRQEINDRAPGVPVDMASAAIHREALEHALGDLMSGKPVDLSDMDAEGATFARPEIDESHATDIIREEFQKSGVLDTAGQFDRWLAGEEEPRPAEKPTAIEPPEEPATPKGEVPEQFKAEGEETEPGEAATQAGAARAITDRPDLEIANEEGESVPAADAIDRAKEEESQANAEAEPMHQAAIECEARHA